MKMYHWWKPLLTALLLATLAACGGGQADAPADEADAPANEANTGGGSGEIGGIPVYPGASQPESGSPLAQGMEAMQQQMQGMQELEGVDMQAEGYILPEGTTFEDVRSFYNEELTGQGWQAMEDIDEGLAGLLPGGGGMAGWMKNDIELFSIMVMQDPQSGSNFLLISYATES